MVNGIGGFAAEAKRGEEQETIKGTEVLVMVGKLCEVRERIRALPGFSKRTISQEEVRQLAAFPSNEKFEALPRLATEVERDLRFLRGKPVEGSEDDPNFDPDGSIGCDQEA